MLNYIWAVLIFTGVIYGALTGHISDVTNGALDSAKEAVELCITMLGVMSLWTGLMEIAQRSGIISLLTKKIMPVMHWLFPDVPSDDEAMSHISMNMIANFLGLGWAATPAGLRAMKALARINPSGCDNSCNLSASNAMCTFLVLNISSIQLIPVNIIAYRSQYGSVNPASIVGPAILATTISTIAGVIFCRLAMRFGR